MDNLPNNYFSGAPEPKKGISTWLGLLIIIIIAALVGAGILGYQYSISNQNPVVTETPAVKAITEDSLRNAVLSYPNPYDESKTDTIKLVNGHAIIYDNGNEMPRDYTVATTTVGDLNNDGKEEGVIGAYQGYGANIIGPVVFVISENNGVLSQVASVAMPEETIDSEIKSLVVADGVLSVNLLVISPDDLANLPHSEWQPTVTKTFKYKLVDGNLVEQVDTTGWETYKNDEYGFEISFPDFWKDYSIVKSSWAGNGVDNSEKYSGVKMIFKNKKLYDEKKFDGIPIMVITTDVWKLIGEEKIVVSAAPIGPTKIGENGKYIFATPPRWYSFSDNLSSEEISVILQIVKTFKGI